MTSPASVAAIVLAAGASRRMGTAKQLLAGRDGLPLVHHAAATALAADLSPVIVVLGANAEAVRAGLHTLDVQTVVCAEWDEGMHRSLAAGIRALRALPHHPSAVMVTTCDQPDVTADDLRAIADAWRTSHAPMVATAHGDTGAGVPALFAQSHWPLLGSLPAGEGARTLLRSPGARVEMYRPARAATRDLDTPEDYEAWRSSAE